MPGQAEVVEAEVRAVVDQAQVVVGVDRAAAVADDHPCEVDAFLLEDALLFEAPRLGWRRRVRGDGHPGGAVRLRHGARARARRPG